jgi:hypothetical protein
MRAGERIEGKDLRRRAFALARERYDALWPALTELAELEAAQAELERLRSSAARERKAKKRGAAGGKGR